jgi:hypothetical protein
MTVKDLIDSLQQLNEESSKYSSPIDNWEITLRIDGIESSSNFGIWYRGPAIGKITLNAFVNAEPKIGFDSADN